MRVLTVCLLLLVGGASCGGNVVVDRPVGSGGAAGAGEPCPGFNLWCDYITRCDGAALCNPSICPATKPLACLAALPSDASCEQMAACGGA